MGQRQPGRYQRQQTPTPNNGNPAMNPTAPVPTTISGLPVGYQMRLDQQQYQINQLAEQNRVLMYERDQADTAECLAEIRRLAGLGFQVDEYEVNMLKQTPREQRAAVIQHITTKYQRVATDYPPPILGDPTPGEIDQHANRPLSEQEMNAALAMSANDPSPTAYANAIQAVRYGGVNRMAGVPGGQPAGPQFDPSNPYGEPSQNGQGGY
jgi:hypothetical protein